MTSPARYTLLLCAAATLLAASCATAGLHRPPRLADCKGPPLAGADTATLDSAGGTLSLPSAGHSLQVPPGAVRQPTFFRLAEEADSMHVVVEAHGDGTFDPGVRLTLNVRRCARQNGLKMVRIVDGSLEEVRSELSGSGPGRGVTAQLEHLSRYAVAE